MPLADTRIEECARALDEAARERRTISKLTDTEKNFSLLDGYAVQWALRKRRLTRGAKLTGLKMGLTSYAKMKQMGVESPIYGYLLDEYYVASNSAIAIAELIHPRVEPEIALVTQRDLRGPGCTIAQALAGVAFAAPALEIIDSRYRDFKFDLPSVVADNGSSARYVVGTCAQRIEELDLRTLGVVVQKNGDPIAFGAGAAVLGHPALSLAMLANLLADRQEFIPAGTYVMTGGITEAMAISAGDHFEARFQGLGSVSVRFN
jgi:2-oxo-3-hexenedioate decarboxylase